MNEDKKYIIYPEVCPVCGESTQLVCDNGVKTLHCGNSDCAARKIGNLMNTFSKDGLFIKGLGESQIQDLMEHQLVSAYPVSFYNLARANYGDNDFEKRIQSLLNKDGWGKKKWQNLIDAIIESRETTLQKFLYSLNIPMLGNDLSKKLSKLWHNNIEEFLEFYKNPSFNTLNAIDGIGTEKANNVVDWCNNTRHDMLADLMLKTLIDELHFPAETETNNDSSLSGITFVITGAVHDYKNRDEFKASVEARGGKVAGSVSAKTNYLVNNDVNSTTGKNQKAKELGIEIISEDEFITRFGR